MRGTHKGDLRKQLSLQDLLFFGLKIKILLINYLVYFRSSTEDLYVKPAQRLQLNCLF